MNKRTSPRWRAPGRRGNAGMSMIEVLIAIVILTFGMLGIAALQALALRSSQSSIARNEAIAQSYAVLDAMRANRASALLGGYNLGAYDAGDEDQTSWICDPPEDDNTLVSKDLNEWMTRMQSAQGLGPGSCAIIAPVPGIQDTFQVRLRWNDSRGDTGGGNQSENQTIVTTSRL